MNKIIPGALYLGSRNVDIQRDLDSGKSSEDVRKYDCAWDRAAERFRRNDPRGMQLPMLFYIIGKRKETSS